MSAVDISVVIPMMNEEDGIHQLLNRVIPILDTIGMSWEIVCVNDGSTDTTIDVLLKAAADDSRLVIVDLSRNFGKEAALTAGIAEARGRCVIPLDADLQDPPELIPEMVEKWRSGAEVVLAVRQTRTSDTMIKRKTANMFYSVINSVSDIAIPPNAGDFRLMDRCVVSALQRLPERTRFNKGLFAWVGFNSTSVFYERPDRAAGTTKWRYRKLWSFALDGITSFSTLPLRIWSYLGFVIALCSMLYGFYIIIKVVVFDAVATPGYASIMTTIMFSTGLILLTLGVIGEYLSRIFVEVKERPLYLVRRVFRKE